jgi:hypothetical protein
MHTHTHAHTLRESLRTMMIRKNQTNDSKRPVSVFDNFTLQIVFFGFWCVCFLLFLLFAFAFGDARDVCRCMVQINTGTNATLFCYTKQGIDFKNKIFIF